MKDTYKKYLFLALFFVLGFAVAMLMGRSSPIPEESKNAGENSAPVDSARLTAFLDAATRGDYETMARIGRDLFRKGAPVPDSKERLKEFAANSYPPFAVYAFYSEGSDTRVRRVLLTLDEKERVESFLAEEMVVTK